MNANKYKHVVPGLIFFKYISDKFEERYRELVVEGENMEEDRDEYTSQNIFFVPPSARWAIIA
jgi:type I restriction enzyme M protein